MAVTMAVMATASLVVVSGAADAASTAGSRPASGLADSGVLAGSRQVWCHWSPAAGAGMCLRQVRAHVISRRAAVHRPAAARRSSATSSSLPSPPPQCGFSPTSFVASPDRFTSCDDVAWELYTYVTTLTGVQITGSMNLQDYQWNSYSVSSLTWTHGLTVDITAASGTLENGADAYVMSECDFSKTCVVTGNLGPADSQLVLLAPSSSPFTDGWTEAETGPPSYESGQVDVQSPLGVYFKGPAATGIPAWNYTDDNLTGRCDSVVTSPPPANSPVGCVNQAYIPTMTLSLAQYGASAAMIEWAQDNLSGHWGIPGQGQPLHRLTDTVLSDNNYEIICGDKSGFTPDPAITKALKPYGDKDTCDEFPFQSSYESGAMEDGANGKPKPYVTTGADCAQVKAVQTGTSGKDEAADWKEVTPIGTPTSSEPCVRGHIPGKLNSAVGGAYSSTIRANRLVSKDPFWLSVTS
jgi:hypothetical protein